MPKLQKSSGYQNPSAGTQTGVLVKIIDLGTQKNTFDPSKRPTRQLLMGWELPEDLMDDGRPLTISKFVTFSMNEKATLTEIIKASTGSAPQEGFNPNDLLGTACNLNIESDGEKVKVKNFSQLKRGEKAPKPSDVTLTFDLDDFDAEIFESLSPKIKEMVKTSPEYDLAVNPQPYRAKEAPVVDNDLDDEIPF